MKLISMDSRPSTQELYGLDPKALGRMSLFEASMVKLGAIKDRRRELYKVMNQEKDNYAYSQMNQVMIYFEKTIKGLEQDIEEM